MKTRMNREYKSTLFALIFGENKKDLLDLFNAVNGTSYQNEEEIEYNTLESDRGFFLRLKNDLSFILDWTLNLYEHQSSPTSANIALRLLYYFSDLLRTLIDGKRLYRTKLVKFPVPRFIVFYNGRKDEPDETVFLLSEMFAREVESPEIELRVRMLNINYGKNRRLMEKCIALEQYAEFVRRMREALDKVRDKEQRRRIAAEVVDQAIEDGILSDILRTSRSEVIEMYYWEYDEEAHHWAIEQDAREEGLEQGIKQGIEQGVENGVLLDQIRLVTKKVRKGKALDQIIDDLESDEAAVKPIWEAVKAEAPDYDEERILQRLTNDGRDATASADTAAEA